MPNTRPHANVHAHMHAQTRTRERRQQLAHEAARLMAEGGIRDYHQAKLKAAQRLGIHDDASLPRNREIEGALREYQRLFLGSDQPVEVRRRRLDGHAATCRHDAGGGDHPAGRDVHRAAANHLRCRHAEAAVSFIPTTTITSVVTGHHARARASCSVTQAQTAAMSNH